MFSENENVYKKNGKHFESRVSNLYEDKILRGYVAWIFDMTFIDNYTQQILALKEEDLLLKVIPKENIEYFKDNYCENTKKEV